MLADHRFDFRVAEREATRFRDFANASSNFTERDAKTLLREMPNFTVAIGGLASGMSFAAAFKYEFRVQGVVAADLVLRNASRNSALFVEFEGAEGNDIFAAKGTNQLKSWARRLEHAESQVIDWSWAIKDAAASTILEQNLGMRNPEYHFMIVCGRDSELSSAYGTERSRYAHRRKAVSINGDKIRLYTYDELLSEVELFVSATRAKSVDDSAQTR